jgi:hypothetical protein
MDVNREDPVEVELAADLHVSALSHVAGSTCNTYSGQFNMFFEWCASLAVPRAPLPASEATVALYLQSLVNRAKTFTTVKAAVTTIAFYQRVNLFDHGPTQCPAVCLVLNAAMQRFGRTPKNRKEPFVCVGGRRPLHGGIRREVVELLPPGGGYDGGHHVRRDVPI